MGKDITIGQYYPADSVLHKLDPRVKITGTILYIVSLFLMNSWGYLLGAGFLACVIACSRVPFSFLVRGLKAIWILLIFTIILNLLLTPGEAVVSLGVLHITDAGIAQAVSISVRLIFLIVGASVMTLTTTPNKLTDALESLLSPLKKLHVPVHEIAMMMSIAMRFIPILMEETDKIMKAQLARGADFESGGLIKKVKALTPLLIPLFLSAFRRANDLALAMEARCYHGGEGRTQMNPLHCQRRDRIALLILLVYLAVVILGRILLRW